MMDSGQEQRRSSRWLLRTPVNVALAAGRALRGRSFDISTGGLSVICQAAVAVNSSVQVSLVVTHAIGGKGVTLVSRCKVIDCVFDGRNNGFRVRMQFLELDEAARTAIESHLPEV